jgi:hypothetical protein
MNHLYALRTLHLYKIKSGYFIIDDTMKHHTKFCKWIHGVFVLFDHAFNTNLKATCIVFLYHNDGGLVKFPICHRIFYREDSPMPWGLRKKIVHKKKYELAIEMIEWAMEKGFPKCCVLADSWYGIEPFIKGLKRLRVSYIVEVKPNLSVKVKCDNPKLTPSGKMAKRQYDLIKLPVYFERILSHQFCGFAADEKTGKKEKILYRAKISTVRLNSIAGKHRIVESFDPSIQTAKYLLTDQLSWEATKIISVYCYRWVIEEFFRNAKQLTDMEGATIRSEQGVTTALCLVSWIDFLLHFENYKQSTAGKLSRGSVTIPSIVRQAQYENLRAVLDRASHEEDFIQKWLAVEKENIFRKRKQYKEMVLLDDSQNQHDRKAA